MENLVEILKIIEGGLNRDEQKVFNYSELLAQRLLASGDKKSSDRIMTKLKTLETSQFVSTTYFPNKMMPVDSEAKIDLADEVCFDDNAIEIFLSKEIEYSINNFIEYVRHSEKLFNEGITISPSLLIYGPPGCGKTELAKYLASKIKLPLLIARSDALISSYLGSTSKNIRHLFEYIKSRPCILFLDELDALAKARDDHNELGELKRVVITLLQNIDKLDSSNIIIAATNHEHLLDSAIWRRFTYKIHLKKPDIGVRQNLFKKYLGRFLNEKMIKSYVEISDGLSGSEIKDLCEEAIREAVLKDVSNISDQLLLRQIIQLTNKDISFTPQNLENEIKQLRNIDNKIFTYELLSNLFNVSTGKISSLLTIKE